MFHGHKRKVTFLLLYYTPLLLSLILLVVGPGKASISSSISSRSTSGLSDYYFGERSGTSQSDISSSNNVRNSERIRNHGGGNGLVSASSRGEPPSSNTNANFSEDTLRRELIKVQILQRLGLNEKPHVDMAHKISKDLVLEALRRTENFNPQHHQDSSSSSSLNSITGSFNHNNASINLESVATSSTAAGLSNHADQETGVANYAKTSEIISFPDKGKHTNYHQTI